MFIIEKSGSYTWPVVIKTPTDGGKLEESTFKASFRRFSSQEKLKSLCEQLSDAKAFCRDVLTGWDDISMNGTDPFVFTPENMEKLLDVPFVAAAIATAFMESVVAGREKN